MRVVKSTCRMRVVKSTGWGVMTGAPWGGDVTVEGSFVIISVLIMQM